MPESTKSLSAKDVLSYVRNQIEDHLNAGRVGAEIEWLTVPIGEPHLQTDFDMVRLLLPEGLILPAGGKITYEPGGQMEISTLPSASADAVCESIAIDFSYAQSAIYEEDVRLVGAGYEPFRKPDRVKNSPRYDAMENYFDSAWPQGRLMMRETAAIQVNVDPPTDSAAAWRLAHSLGPTLAAAFANSPIAAGRPSGWQSTRLGVWQAIDPSRTTPALATGDPAIDWAQYALDARVMFIAPRAPLKRGGATPRRYGSGGRGRAGPSMIMSEREDLDSTTKSLEPILVPLTFHQWIESGHELGYPTLHDFQTHLTTLFPPVRPKGWLEMRMIDALSDPWWRVPILVVKALLHDETALAAAFEAASSADGLWAQAARDGLNNPLLRASAVACFEIASDVLTAGPCEHADVVGAFYERYVRRGRTLADEILENWRKQQAGDRIKLWA